MIFSNKNKTYSLHCTNCLLVFSYHLSGYLWVVRSPGGKYCELDFQFDFGEKCDKKCKNLDMTMTMASMSTSRKEM